MSTLADPASAGYSRLLEGLPSRGRKGYQGRSPWLVSNHVQLRTVRNYGVCSRQISIAREMVMPIGRYIAWVGASLLALLFVADWYLPKPLPEPAGDAINRPVIRIASVQQPPERISIDTSQPTIVPPPTLVGDPAQSELSPPLQSHASAVSPATVAHVDQKKRKITKRQGPKVAAYQPPLGSTPAVASGSSTTTIPLTRLSFTDIISGQLVRNLFNLN
jgi:hypothetical protein